MINLFQSILIIISGYYSDQRTLLYICEYKNEANQAIVVRHYRSHRTEEYHLKDGKSIKNLKGLLDYRDSKLSDAAYYLMTLYSENCCLYLFESVVNNEPIDKNANRLIIPFKSKPGFYKLFDKQYNNAPFFLNNDQVDSLTYEGKSFYKLSDSTRTTWKYKGIKHYDNNRTVSTFLYLDTKWYLPLMVQIENESINTVYYLDKFAELDYKGDVITYLEKS